MSEEVKGDRGMREGGGGRSQSSSFNGSKCVRRGREEEEGERAGE